MKSFLLALQFLTRLPLPAVHCDDPRLFGRSMLFYPLVGVLIGLLLVGLAVPLAGVSPVLAAALLLLVWVFVTGALHLDGLADSADAWLGGHGDRERSLAIMKDPRSGPAAVVVLVCLLLAKYAALQVLLAGGDWRMLGAAPMLGRLALPALFLTTPYVRAGGLGSVLAENMPRISAVLVVLLGLLAFGLWLGRWSAAPIVSAILAFIWLRHLMIRRLGGTTGDTAGAMVEIVELSVLAAAALQV